MDSARIATNTPSVAYVIDPRFPGGTSSAIAAELEVVSRLARVQVHALETKMFSTRYIVPQLRDVFGRLNLPIEWNSREIAADIVIFHNLSCLKFQNSINTRIIAQHLIVVTHENLLRPGGAPAFDVEKCLSQITCSSIALQRSLAPISAWNRKTAQTWCRKNSLPKQWSLLENDWFNICAFENKEPASSPKDRRGRHSRAGLEKFPSRDVMDLSFPETAECNIILGADSFLRTTDTPAHWTLYPFGGLTLEHYFDQIDFFVYFTSAGWRESFGRVIAEAIAAGKIVITDRETARTFDGAAIAAAPADVDQIISGYISQPDRYQADALAAQEVLKRFSADAFQTMFNNVVGPRS